MVPVAHIPLLTAWVINGVDFTTVRKLPSQVWMPFSSRGKSSWDRPAKTWLRGNADAQGSVGLPNNSETQYCVESYRPSESTRILLLQSFRGIYNNHALAGVLHAGLQHLRSDKDEGASC